MELRIEKIKDNFPYELLLLADETIKAIHKYLFNSSVYIAKQGEETVAVCCLYQQNDQSIEIKNIAVASAVQNQGIGTSLMTWIEQEARRQKKSILLVGTADCGKDQIRFYERNGYKKDAVRKNFFLENYDVPIYENGILLKDMLMLKKTLKEK